MPDQTDNIIDFHFCPVSPCKAEAKAPSDSGSGKSAQISGPDKDGYYIIDFQFGNGVPTEEYGIIDLIFYPENYCTCQKVDPWIKWCRPPLYKSAGSTDDLTGIKRLEDIPVITFVVPTHCHWHHSDILYTGSKGSETYFHLPRNKDCPDSGGCDEPIKDNAIVPGEAIELVTVFFDQTHFRSCVPYPYAWYGTGCLTGGTIKVVNSKYGDEKITYDVEVMGEILPKVKPTDWVHWEKGDWVFLHHISCEDACDKKKEEVKTAYDWSSLAGEYKSYHEKAAKIFNSDDRKALDEEWAKKKAEILIGLAANYRILPLRIGYDGA